MSAQTRVRLYGLINELSDLAEDIDAFAPDSEGGQLFDAIAEKAHEAARLARDLNVEAHNTAAENGERTLWWLSN